VSAQGPAGETARVTRVVDGDTIYVEIAGRTYPLRYIGVDSPESTRRQDCFGKEATRFNASLVANQTVTLEKDVNNTDPSNRLLRYVYLRDGRMVNEELVKAGYAYAKSYPPDVKYQERFRRAQQRAVASKRGLWSACPAPTAAPTTAPTTAPTSTPTATATRRPRATATPGFTHGVPPINENDCPATHPIKGNINSKGERIYHTTRSRDYGRTKPEVCFATESDAKADGFRAPRT
jgi:micrococcal nuclease